MSMTRKRGPKEKNPWPDRLKALRKKLDMSQVQLGKKLRCGQSIISRIESGERMPDGPLSYLIELAESGII